MVDAVTELIHSSQHGRKIVRITLFQPFQKIPDGTVSGSGHIQLYAEFHVWSTSKMMYKFFQSRLDSMIVPIPLPIPKRKIIGLPVPALHRDFGHRNTARGTEIFVLFILNLPTAIVQQFVDGLAGFLFGCHGFEVTWHNSTGELPSPDHCAGNK
jgi:hypothetical protein